MVNRENFLSKVRTNDLTCAKVAAQLDIDPATLSAKINNKRKFTVSEVEGLKFILKLTQKDINSIFFD